jgi:predicted heme/steroid binding protein
MSKDSEKSTIHTCYVYTQKFWDKGIFCGLYKNGKKMSHDWSSCGTLKITVFT